MGGIDLKLVLVRVDDRLIHGQVVLGWTRAVSANRIVVADNATANDSMQQTLLKLAAPSGVKVSILTTDEAGEQLSSSTFKGENVMVLVRGPEALLDLKKAGVEFSKVNVGNVRRGGGTWDLSVINANGSGRSSITNDRSLVREFALAWSPKETRLVFGGELLPQSSVVAAHTRRHGGFV
jgi:mannose/fructose/N-acetylgalactosamine-specific phosphotransferase system component IIB